MKYENRGFVGVEKILEKNLEMILASSYLCSPFNKKENGSVVQLVRIHACHAWGRGFESRPDRQISLTFVRLFLFIKRRFFNLKSFN